MTATLVRALRRKRWLRDTTFTQWWLENTRWVNDRPGVVIAVLAVLGLALRQSWMTTKPLAAGDWAWRDLPRLAPFFPFPHIWDPTLGPGGANRFLAAFRFPLYAVSGALAKVGASWTVIEKVLYFIPFAILLPIVGWLLAREIMGRTRWTLLAPLLLVGNTYFLVEPNGEIPLTVAEAVCMLALVTFLRAMRRRALGWATFTGLLLAVASTFDIRPAYISVVLMALYWAILSLSELDLRRFLRRTALGLAAGAVFLASQAFWIIPLVTYHGNPGFPIPPSPDFPILTLGHGLTGVIALWTGGLPSVNVQAALNPMFMILPLLALAPLLARRLTVETLWLALAALSFAFFANTNNAPFGFVYDWMYTHVPGWSLFREGSKFLFVVGIAYAILIPTAFKMAFDWASGQPKGWRPRWTKRVAWGGVLAVGAVVLSGIVVLETGALDSSTNPTTEPASFAQLSQMLHSDSREGSVLWVGSGETVDSLRHHTFVIASQAHPLINLTGTYNPANDVMHRDPFQLYCADPQVPFCYLDKDLFTYLTGISGAAYVVVPAGQGVGALPHDITRPWLQEQMTSFLGRPATLGSGTTELLVWHLPSAGGAVTMGPAIAAVQSGTWSAAQALPALRALDVPAAYLGTSDVNHYPRAPSSLPDSIAVLPRSDGGCAATAVSHVALMAQGTASSIAAQVGGRAETLPLLAAASRLPGWGFYGPLNLSAGHTQIEPLDTSMSLGPCVAWSALTTAVLQPHADTAAATVLSGGERVRATMPQSQQRWVELHRFYDGGWQLATKRASSTGDGIFDLYHLSAAQAASTQLVFEYSTHTWELIGLASSLLAVAVSVFITARGVRRQRPEMLTETIDPPLTLAPSRAARWVAAVGMGVLGFTALAVTAAWFGLPSSVPGIATASDPYGLVIGYGACAIALLICAVAIRLGSNFAARRRDRAMPEARQVPVPARAVAAATLLLITVLSGCGSSAQSLQSQLGAAQGAGQSQNIDADSLDEARLARAAHDPELCIKDYTAAMAAFPNLLQTYTGRAACYMSGGKDSAAAVHDFTAAIAREPARPDLFLLRASADRAAGNVTAAAADYQDGALLPNSAPDDQLFAIDGLLALARFDQARWLYGQVSQRNRRSSILELAAGDIATATGAEASAAADDAAALKLSTTRKQTGQVLIRICHREVLEHQFSKALSDCHAAVGWTPNNAGAYDDLSAVDLALGNPTSALGDTDAAIGAWIGDIGKYAQPAGVDGFGLAHLYAARGWIEVRLHHTKDAVANFKQALASLRTAAPDARARLKAAIATAQSD